MLRVKNLSTVLKAYYGFGLPSPSTVASFALVFY